MRSSLFVAGVLSFTLIQAQAQKNSTDSLTIEKAIARYRIGAPRFSPDGKKIAFAVTEPVKGAGPANSDIWLFQTETKTLSAFTNSPKADNNPKWSPDGKELGFLSNRNGETQVYLIAMSGGEARPLTQSKTSVRNFEWSPDGKTIAFLAQEPPTEAEEKEKTTQDDERVMNQDEKPTRLWTIETNTGIATQLSQQNWEITDIKWVPASDKLLLVTQPLPKNEKLAHQLALFSVKDKTITSLTSPRHPFWGSVQISPDGKTVAYTAARTNGPTAHDLFLQSVSGGEPRNVTSEHLDLPVIDYRFMRDGEIVVSAQKGFAHRMFLLKDGQAIPYRINENVGSFDLSAAGAISFVSYTSTQPEELWLQTAKTSERLTNFNKAFAGYSFVKPEFITYKSFDGTLIEASYYTPPIKTGAKFPLAVLIHGGPTGAWSDNYHFWPQLFLQRGYAVICPNIRGSTGYGWKFLGMNHNDWGGGDFKDVMAGVDYLIARGEIDENRLGIAGWSYGGYMAGWAITQTNRFKVSMAGAGLSDLASEFGTEDNAAYDEWFFGTPYESLQNFARSSPITFIKNAKTPTLIIQGEKDPVDPVGQSQQLYRGLRYYGVPAELVLYPREPHGFQEEKHVVDYLRRTLAWFDHYCK